VADNQLEHVIRDYIAEHLWLLDPAWERATDSVQVESTLTKEFQDIERELTAAERAGRFDIKYATFAKNHIVIELKRPERPITKPELEEQGDKYYRGLRKLLNQRGRSDEQVLVVFLVGTEPLGWEDASYRQRDVDSLRVKKHARALLPRVAYQCPPSLRGILGSTPRDWANSEASPGDRYGRLAAACLTT